MEPQRRHTYVIALIAAGMLFVIGTFVVLNRAGVSSSGNSNGLNINGTIQGTNSAQPIPVAPPPVRPTAVDVPFRKITTQSTSTPTETPEQPASLTFDWNIFIKALTHTGSTKTTSGDATTTDPYSFLPSGLISIPEPLSTISMPENIKPLHSWGEDAGTVIVSFESSHPNQPQILKDFVQDRQNPAKVAAMKKLGADLSEVGDLIGNIDPIPPQLSTAAPALAEAYRTIGRNLAAIPDASGDDALVKAILFYDKSAEEFVGKYVHVVQILQINGVKYSQDEPGGVFMFPNQ